MFPSVVCEASNFCTPRPTLAIFQFGIIAIGRYEVVSHCGLGLHFSNDKKLSIFFPCAYWPFVYLFCRNAYSNALPVLKLGFCLFIVEL